MPNINFVNYLKNRKFIINAIKSIWYPSLDLKWFLQRSLTRQCPVCTAKSPFDRISAHNRIFLKCRACDHIWAHDYSRFRALIGMGMTEFGGGEPDTGGDSEMLLARFCRKHFDSQSILLYGTGPTRAFRELFNEGLDVYGCDVSGDVIAFRQAEFGANRFFHVKQLGDMKFDVIISTEVIEHLFDPVNEMMGIVSHCKPGGIFCGSTGFSQGGGVDEHVNRYMAPRGHVIYWSERSLKTAFQKLGMAFASFPLGTGQSTARLFFGTSDPAIAAKLDVLRKEPELPA